MNDKVSTKRVLIVILDKENSLLLVQLYGRGDYEWNLLTWEVDGSDISEKYLKEQLSQRLSMDKKHIEILNQSESEEEELYIIRYTGNPEALSAKEGVRRYTWIKAQDSTRHPHFKQHYRTSFELIEKLTPKVIKKPSKRKR